MGLGRILNYSTRFVNNIRNDVEGEYWEIFY